MNKAPQKKTDRLGPRFYYPDKLGNGSEVRLPADAAHHALRVLRLTPGEPVTLFNGRGGEYQSRITRMAKGEVWVKTVAYSEPTRESSIELVLAQGVSSGDRMDITLQKSVELGVGAIQPISAERSIVRLSAERAARRVEHWRKLVISACEQCGRNRIPDVAAPARLEDWLGQLPAKAAPGELRVLLSPEAQTSVKALPPRAARIVLLAGPEGGFSPAEIAAALSRDFVLVRLGPRILRTETAALAALAALQALQGDF
ncbi:MAG: 16S rRNA (uracil(1498)-N(3))-methyltransferase [Burkholderiales bacterium]